MKKLHNLALFCTASACSTPAFSGNQLEVILDGYAYRTNSDVIFNLSNQTISIADSEINNCIQSDQSVMPNNALNFTLLTNNQNIGIAGARYLVDGNLLFLTSETSNLVCDDGIDVDTIFTQGFEQFVSPFLIFSDGFD